MLGYAFGRGCRTRFIYDYFAGAARGGSIPRCGTCDVCLGWRSAAGRTIDDREYERVRIALSAVARLPGRFGVARIAQVLAGSRSREVIDRGLDRIPTFGRLGDMRPEEIKALLDALVDAALLERRGIEGGRPGAFVVTITEEGVAVMRAERRPTLALQPTGLPRGRLPAGPVTGSRRAGRASSGSGRDSTDRVVPGMEVADLELLARLKKWRAAEAKRRGLPAYVIFHDTTLEALAASRPRDTGGLRAVRGVGPAKIEAYGETLLQMLAGPPGLE
jgi:ATP-dependent DNA helicase RecQ